MSFLDNLKKFAQPYADDDYDDYDDEEYLDDEYDEPAPRRAPSRRAAPAPAPVEEEEDDDFGFGMSTAPAAAPAAAPAPAFSGRVVNMTTGAKQEVVLFRPANFGETT